MDDVMPIVPPGPRYAIYYVPVAGSDFFRFGSSVLGYDCYSGETVERPDDLNTDPELWDKLTAEPRRFGFHATLKSPFQLSPSCKEAQLISALHSFAGLGHAIPALTPTIRMLSGFAALVPSAYSAAVDTLAANSTTIFDAFRAPMSAQERARRVALGLNQSQIKNLDRWGYPYLFSDFRFHMTLTGKVGVQYRVRVIDALQQAFHRSCENRPMLIDRIALVRQDNSESSFRVVEQAALRAG